MSNSPHEQSTPGPSGPHNGSNHGVGNGSLVPVARPLTELLPQPVTPDGPKPNTLQQKALFAAFRRRWFLALSLGLLFGGITAGVVWYLVPAPYHAFAELRMRSVAPRVFFKTNEVQVDFRTYKETQIRLLRSKFVLAAALRKPGIAKLPTLADVPYPVEWLERNLQISTPGSEFVRLSLSGDHPQDLAAIINAVYESYLSDVVDSDQASRKSRRKSLEDIHRGMEDKLRTKDNAVKKLAEALSSGDSEALTLKQQLALENFGQLRKHHAEIKFELMQAETELDIRQQTVPGKDELEIPAATVNYYLEQDPTIAPLRVEVQRIESLYDQTKRAVSSLKNPILVKYKTQLDKARADLELKVEELRPVIGEQLRAKLLERSEASIAQIKRKVELLKIQETRLREEMESQDIAAKRIGIESFELESLKQEISQMKKVADSLAAEIQRLDIELGAEARTTGHREAEIPHTPDVARKHKMAGVAGMGVFGLIVAAIVWLEFSARRISTLDEVVDGLSLRILGSLPIMPSWMSKGKSRGKRSRDSVLRSVWTESIDATRTVLLRDARFDSKKVVMICSAIGGEGKTTLSCHLATSLARSGRKTLLIDTDMRRCSLHKVFEVQQCPGFSELMRGEVTLDEAIQPLPTEGLYLLAAGKINQHTLQALSGKGPVDLFEQIKAEFDFVIVDSAPILPVNDSLLIGQYVDAILFSIRRDYSRYGKVASACERMAMLGVPLLGAVVVGLDESSYGYRYPYRYYAYGGYGYHVHGDAMKQ